MFRIKDPANVHLTEVGLQGYIVCRVKSYRPGYRRPDKIRMKPKRWVNPPASFSKRVRGDGRPRAETTRWNVAANLGAFPVNRESLRAARLRIIFVVKGAKLIVTKRVIRSTERITRSRLPIAVEPEGVSAFGGMAWALCCRRITSRTRQSVKRSLFRFRVAGEVQRALSNACRKKLPLYTCYRRIGGPVC